MSLLKSIRQQLGLSVTPDNNFTLDASAADGTMKLARGNAGATTQDILTVDASGNVVFPQKISQGTAQSMVRLNTANGYGSTNVTVRRFTNTVTSQGSDITYTDSATLGASFTINTSGVYAVSFSDTSSNAGGTHVGVSLNGTQLSTNVGSVNVDDLVCFGSIPVSSYSASCSTVLYLPAGSVLRAQTSGTASATPAALFTITRVA